jgi:single-strand DNA-binding protein
MIGAPQMTIIGTVVGDPELRFTPSGHAVANWTVACNPRKFDKAKNEYVEEEAIFIRCSAWREMAENVAETLLKGQRVIVTGTLKVRQYESDKGKGTSVECDVEEVGPSLRWASARVDKNTRKEQGSGQRQRSSDSGGDPWGGSGGAGGFPDEPPF